MAIWEMRPGDTRGRPVLVAADEQDVDARTFVTDGSSRDWAHRPPVEFYTRAPKAKQREPANLLPFVSGTFVLDAKARAALGGFLSRFGQLLELHRTPDGETLYMFNCTNVIDCIDLEATRKTEDGQIELEVVDEAKVPAAATVFKAPQTARVRVYLNDQAREVVEKWAEDGGITGIEISALDPI